MKTMKREGQRRDVDIANAERRTDGERHRVGDRQLGRFSPAVPTFPFCLHLPPPLLKLPPLV